MNSNSLAGQLTSDSAFEADSRYENLTSCDLNQFFAAAGIN